LNQRIELKLLGFSVIIWAIRVVLALINKDYADSPFHFIVLCLTTILWTILFLKRLNNYRSGNVQSGDGSLIDC